MDGILRVGFFVQIVVDVLVVFYQGRVVVELVNDGGVFVGVDCVERVVVFGGGVRFDEVGGIV